MSNYSKFFLVGFFIIALIVAPLGCGIKGPPLPPINEETIQKQKSDEIVSKAASADATKAKKSKKK